MNSEDLKRKISEWVRTIGPKEAAKRLISADISLAITQKLVAGNYESALSYDRGQAIIKEMAKDGITLESEEAS